MEENARNANEDVVALSRLAKRLLAPPDPNREHTSALPLLYPGRLPDGLPVELPMPDGTTLVGGSTQDLGRGRWINEIVLDAEQPAERFRENYRRQLFAAGWCEDEDWMGPGRRGFVPSGLPGLFVRAAHRSPWLKRRLSGRVPGLPRLSPDLLRLSEGGPGLMVTAADRRNAPTDVRLRILYGRHRSRGHDAPYGRLSPASFPHPARADGRTMATPVSSTRLPRPVGSSAEEGDAGSRTAHTRPPSYRRTSTWTTSTSTTPPV